MVSNLVTEEYCSLDTLKHLKYLIYDLDGVRFDIRKISFLAQEYDDAPWEMKYLINKCMAHLTTARGYLSDACDNLAKQSDGADK